MEEEEGAVPKEMGKKKITHSYMHMIITCSIFMLSLGNFMTLSTKHHDTCSPKLVRFCPDTES